MTSAISCSLWSSVYEYQRVECAFTSPVRIFGMFVMTVHCLMTVSTVLECGCAVSRRYIIFCNCDMFSVVNVLLLFATTRSVFKSVKVSVVEIGKRTN